MAKKTYYYHEDLKDDFGNIGHNGKALPESFTYLKRNILFKIVSFCLYYGLAFPILWGVSKIFLGVKVKNKKFLKKELKKKEGFIIYSNHCHYFDAFLSHSFIGFPKRTYVISHADPIMIPFVGMLVQLLGCLPLPNTKTNYRNFIDAMHNLLDKGKVIAIYPEGTLWPYYNGLRNIEKTSFRYAAMMKKPIIVCAETFRKSKWKNRKPRMNLILSHVIYPKKDFSIKENEEFFYEEAIKFLKKHVEQKENVGYHHYLPLSQKKNEYRKLLIRRK